jgi:hypothetical protein
LLPPVLSNIGQLKSKKPSAYRVTTSTNNEF